MPSFSRPRVSNDNAYAEALFRTAKYCPLWPERPFDTLEQARNWVNSFVAWYNHEHRHSALKFVTPAQRHTGQAEELLRKRIELYGRRVHGTRSAGRQHQELGAGTNRVPEPGAGSGTAANIKGSVTRSRDNYLENRRYPDFVLLNDFSALLFMRLDGLASVPARVRQKDGFPELTRRHKGLRAGAGLKCTFCSVAPQTPISIGTGPGIAWLDERPTAKRLRKPIGLPRSSFWRG
jgi:hypothetical protein